MPISHLLGFHVFQRSIHWRVVSCMWPRLLRIALAQATPPAKSTQSSSAWLCRQTWFFVVVVESGSGVGTVISTCWGGLWSTVTMVVLRCRFILGCDLQGMDSIMVRNWLADCVSIRLREIICHISTISLGESVAIII